MITRSAFTGASFALVAMSLAFVSPEIADAQGRRGGAGSDNGDGGTAGGPPCFVNCQQPGLIPEGEPCGINTINCGCDCTPPSFLVLRCNEGYCGTSWAINNKQDTDWYLSIVNDSNGDGTEYVCYTLTSEFPAVVQIYSGTCAGGLTLLNQGESDNCTATSVCACVPAPAQYLIKVYAGTIAGGPTLNGFPCTVPDNHYTLKFTCSGVCPTTGACCYTIPGSTIPQCVVTSPQDCQAVYGGVYQGNNTVCTAATCAPQTGACCYVDPVVPGSQCVITTAADCQSTYGGTYQGNNTVCNATTCDPTGACCYQGAAGYTCQTLSQAACAQLGGVYFGNNVPCPPAPLTCKDVLGACCYINTAGVPDCIITTQSDCIQNLHGVYQGNGTNCTPDPCQLGACCYQIPGTIGFTCTQTTQADCATLLNSTWLGIGSNCNVIPDPCNPPPDLGACCWQDGPLGPINCTMTTQAGCANYPSSVWQGPSSSCTPTPPCPDLVGACCYTIPGIPGALCTVTDFNTCHNLGGTYLGNGTNCNPNPCITGACCYPVAGGYGCIQTTQVDCEMNLNGIYIGDNVICNPDTCLIGACCYITIDGGSNCAIMSQAACSQIVGGTYLGNGSVCPLPPFECATGACCHPIPGTTLWTCSVTTQTACTVYLGGTYLGNNVPCSASKCGPCQHGPPPNMSGWWTLDETAGPIANESVGIADGNYLPNVSTGPFPIAGQVGNALYFDGVNDQVLVPPNSQLALGVTDFSVDAWINWEYYNGSGNPEIVTSNGFRFRLVTFSNAPAGLLLWATGGSGHKCLKFGVVIPNQWNHVAATYKQPTSPTATDGVCKLYLNGVLIATHSTAPLNNFSSNGLTRIGASLSSSPSQFWKGGIDEVEIFKRELSGAEIYNIYAYGKCKHRCAAPWASTYCLNDTTLTTNMTVCNDSGTAQNFLLNFSPGVASSTILCASGPPLTSYTILGPNPVTIGPGQCINVPVQINRPLGLHPGMYSCYTFTVTNLNNGAITQCIGSVTRKNKWCFVIPDCCIGIGVGHPATATLKVTNTGSDDRNFPLTVEVMGPDGNQDAEAVSLNGLPPGTRYIGNLKVAPGETIEVPIEVAFLKHVPFTFYDLLVMGPPEEETPGIEIEVQTSKNLYSGPAHDCPGDIEPDTGNHVVDVDDLLRLINAWGECPLLPDSCPEDLTANEVVDVDDLLELINNWGPCD